VVSVDADYYIFALFFTDTTAGASDTVSNVLYRNVRAVVPKLGVNYPLGKYAILRWVTRHQNHNVGLYYE